jgi:carbonic anhydrase/acetyltransferase-like protein (isoleucine patch superfamily)
MNLMTLQDGGWFAAWNCTATGEITIGRQASLWFGAVVRGDVAQVVIGAKTNVQDNAVIHCDTGVPNLIGERVTIGHGAIVHGKSVGDGSLIGMHATVLSRTVIGKECLIAAGAVVPPDMVVPDGMVVMGVPGKISRPVKPDELEYMRWLTEHYIEVVQGYVDGKFTSLRRPPRERPSIS